MIKTDYDLRKEAESIARQIFDDCKFFDAEFFADELRERALEYCYGSQHVIYTSSAIAICGNCNTDEGESCLEELYGERPFANCDSFGAVCTRLAFATLYRATETALQELIENGESK